MKQPRRSFSLLALLVVAFLCQLGERVVAHAVLVGAVPGPNSIVEDAPSHLTVDFSEPVVPSFSHIAVFSHSGQEVASTALETGENPTRLSVPLPPLTAGTYLVSWRVLSAVDGHSTSGTFPFGVGVAQIRPGMQVETVAVQLPTPFTAGARWLNLLGLTLLLGVCGFRLLVWNPIFAAVELEPADRELDRRIGQANLLTVYIGVALLAAAQLLTLHDQAAKFDLFAGEKLGIWLGTQFGRMWALRLALTLAVGAAAVWMGSQLRGATADLTPLLQGRRRWGGGLLLAIGLAITISMVSHSAALARDAAQALLVDLLHLLAAGLWLGGLLQVGVALWQARRLPPEARAWLNWSVSLSFSTLAAGAVGVLLVSGGYLGWKHVGNWTALLSTAYGVTLLAKTGLALPALSLAAINLWLIKPRLDAAYDRPEAEATQTLQRRFRRLVWAEAGFVLLVLGAAALLTDLQRATEAQPLGTRPGALTLYTAAADLGIELQLEPAVVGQNRFTVKLSDGAGRSVEDAEAISLRFTFLGRSMGTSQAEAEPQAAAGLYVADGGYVSLVGPWQVEVAVRRPDTFDTFGAFRLEAGLNGALRPLGGSEGGAEQLATFLTRSGGSITGTLLILFALIWAVLAAKAAERSWQMVPLLLPGLVAMLVGSFQLYTFASEFTPARFMTNPILPDVASIARGEELYADYCSSCHGPGGRGDGPLALQLASLPVDFTAGHTEIHPDGDLFFWVKNGVADTPMPAFGEQLTDEDLWHLVNYVRRLSSQLP